MTMNTFHYLPNYPKSYDIRKKFCDYLGKGWLKELGV
mgnify:CR=1 FL=1